METPRCTRIRRRFGPKALSLMARTLPQERYQRRDAVEGTKGVRPRRGTFRFSTADYEFGGPRGRRQRVQHGETENQRTERRRQMSAFLVVFFTVLFSVARFLRVCPVPSVL